MNQVGAVGLIAALVFATYGMVSGAVAGKLRSPRMLKSAQRAVLGFFAMTTLAVVSLEYVALTNDFHPLQPRTPLALQSQTDASRLKLAVYDRHSHKCLVGNIGRHFSWRETGGRGSSRGCTPILAMHLRRMLFHIEFRCTRTKALRVHSSIPNQLLVAAFEVVNDDLSSARGRFRSTVQRFPKS